MQAVCFFSESIAVQLQTGPAIGNITPEINQCIRASKVKNGSLCATMMGSTGSLTTIEFEPGVVEDLKRAISCMAPPDMEYEHERAWHDGNGHSHVQAALLGPSIAIPIRDGLLKLSTWQQVVAINHDNRPRIRTIEVSITGILE